MEKKILSKEKLESQKTTAIDNALSKEIAFVEKLDPAKEFGKPTDPAKGKDPIDKKREEAIKAKKKLVLNKRVLPKKKAVQTPRIANANNRVVRQRNSNGTITVQAPKIDLKPKGGGSGINFKR